MSVLEAMPSRQISREDSGRRSFPAVAVTSGFDFSSVEFAALHNCSDATAFQHPLWLDALHRIWAPARGATPVTVVGRHEDDRLCFVLPLLLRRVSGALLLESADLGVSDYAAPVVDRAWWDTGPNLAKLRQAVALALPAHDVRRIKPVRPEHVPLWTAFLGGEIRPLPFGAHATAMEGSLEAWHSVALTEGFAVMLERKRKRFFKLPEARLVVLNQPTATADAIERIALWRAGRFEGDIIQNPGALAFYSKVATEGAMSGFARTYALEADGDVVGLAFAIAAAGRMNYLLIGCDYARFGRHSPGLLLYNGMIGDWIKQGGTVFDFTIGDEPFKARFGTHRTPMVEITQGMNWRGSVALAALRLRDRLRAMRAETPIDADRQATGQEVTR